MIRRRSFLALPAALAAAQRDRLGVMCQLGSKAGDAPRVLDAALDAGFARVMVNFAWDTADALLVRQLPRWLEERHLECDALGAYVNCVDPSAVLMNTRAVDFVRALDYAASLRCRRLVAWTGSHTAALMKPDPRNHTQESEDRIVRFLEPHLPSLEERKLTVALETYITLTCPDSASLERLLGRLPNCVGAVMDPPNLTPLRSFPRRDDAMREMFRRLQGRVAVVHLKDFRLKPGGGEYELPGPLGGNMNYPLYAQLIDTLPVDTPLIAEHIAPAAFRATREKLSVLFR